MRMSLSRLWPVFLRPTPRPAVPDPGPVDAIVRLLKNEQVVGAIDRSRLGANSAEADHQG